MAASSERGWGHDDVWAWLLGVGHERACGCEQGQGGLLPHHFVDEHNKCAAPCNCNAPVVGACSIQGDIIASCLAGKVVTCTPLFQCRLFRPILTWS